MSHKPLSQKKKRKRETKIHALSGTRTRELKKQAAVDQCLKPHGHLDEPFEFLAFIVS
jgi:hypothetical protein